jgi:DNA-binding NarL/FixJ family response regulator
LPYIVLSRDWHNSCTGSFRSRAISDPDLSAGETQLARLRIIVADDNPAFLRELISLLTAEFEVVATAADGKSALDLIRRYKPDLVVLDLAMPILNGIELTRELAKHSPSVVICSVETDPEIVEAARQVGALGYVFKVRVKRDLILAVKSAVQGRPFVSPS